MSDAKQTRISRRTLLETTAWSVPAIAVAAAAPARAASNTPEPDINLTSGGCGNTGATQKGCGGDKTLQIPLTLSNQTGGDIVFQLTSMYTCNCATAPTGAGAGVYSGIRGIWRTPSHTIANHDVCTAPTYSACTGGLPNGSILVPDGTVNRTFWIESAPTGSSSTFSTTINWRMLDAATCTVLSTGTAATLAPLAPVNCGG